MEEKRLASLIAKKNFVDRVAYAICGQPRIAIEKLTYEVWVDVDNNDNYFEIIKIIYNGGAMTIRTVLGDSESAIFEEVAKLIYGGYYDEVRSYRELTTEGHFARII